MSRLPIDGIKFSVRKAAATLLLEPPRVIV